MTNDRTPNPVPPRPAGDLLERVGDGDGTRRPFYPQVFRDVVPPGSNDLYGVGCCTARQGYDLTTGLGQVDFANLASALAPVTATFTG